MQVWGSGGGEGRAGGRAARGGGGGEASSVPSLGKRLRGEARGERLSRPSVCPSSPAAPPSPSEGCGPAGSTQRCLGWQLGAGRAWLPEGPPALLSPAGAAGGPPRDALGPDGSPGWRRRVSSFGRSRLGEKADWQPARFTQARKVRETEAQLEGALRGAGRFQGGQAGGRADAEMMKKKKHNSPRNVSSGVQD